MNTPQKITMPVKVKFTTGTYIARLHRCSGSCTSDARTAVERAAQRYIANTPHVSIDSISEVSNTVFNVVFNWGVP